MGVRSITVSSFHARPPSPCRSRPLSTDIISPLHTAGVRGPGTGAGYGYFINNVNATRRIAVDQWPG